MFQTPQADALVDYNLAVMQQALDLLSGFDTVGRRRHYEAAVGPHLRHVYEHYDAFLNGLENGLVDYDARPREVLMEVDADVASARLRRLLVRLRALDAQAIDADIAVVQFGGLGGEQRLVIPSSASRELMFLASHAIHHYAVLRPVLTELGFQLQADFGKAPATVRHEREQLRNTAA